MSKERTVRRTIAAIIHDEDVPVSTRALMWEEAGRTSERIVHRVERAMPGAGVSNEEYDAGELYLIDIEITSKSATRHDLTKFVRAYLPECEFHYITE